MSEAVRLIVEAFVSLNDRKTIEGLRDHRQMLLRTLHEKAGGALDLSQTIRMMNGDLAEIEAGLARLHGQ